MSFMTEMEMRKVFENEISEVLAANNGIYEFHKIGKMSIGISYEYDENMQDYSYYFNLFFGDDYIGIGAFNCIEDAIIIVTEKWNLYSHQFDTIEELRTNKDFQNMGLYEFRKAILAGKEVIVCATNQVYEDIIWGKTYDMLQELQNEFSLFGTGGNKYLNTSDLSTDVREFILAKLEKDGIKFVCVFEEY